MYLHATDLKGLLFGMLKGAKVLIGGSDEVSVTAGARRPKGPIGTARLGRADVGPIPLGKAGMGPAPLGRRWVYGAPLQTSARYARWREGLGAVLKRLNQKLWNAIVSRRLILRASAKAALDRATAARRALPYCSRCRGVRCADEGVGAVVGQSLMTLVAQPRS